MTVAWLNIDSRASETEGSMTVLSSQSSAPAKGSGAGNGSSGTGTRCSVTRGSGLDINEGCRTVTPESSI